MEIIDKKNERDNALERASLIIQMTYFEFFKYKIFNNAVIDFYSGNNIDKETLDSSVNAQALLCALVLTIPFGVIGNLNFDFYDAVQINSIACEKNDYNTAHHLITTSLIFVIYSSVSGLIFCTIYYIFRPLDIHAWWGRGKYFYFLLFALTSSSVRSLLNLTTLLIGFYALASDDYCSTFGSYEQPANITVCILFCICIFLVF